MTIKRHEFELLDRSEDLAALNKPADVSLLADRSGATCLWDGLETFLGQKPYLVHRLDKPTSGVLIIALNSATQRQLTRAFQARAIRKFYLAWVLGEPGASGTIDLPLRKGRKSRYRVAGPRDSIICQQGRWTLNPELQIEGETKAGSTHSHPSLTRFRVLARASNRSLLLLAPQTGRTHQLRVHLAWIGHPILGDRLYGKPTDPAQQAKRLQLHAHRIVLPEFGRFSAPAELDPGA